MKPKQVYNMDTETFYDVVMSHPDRKEMFLNGHDMALDAIILREIGLRKTDATYFNFVVESEVKFAEFLLRK